MEYANDLIKKHVALDKEAEDKIIKFLVKAKNNRWNVNSDVILNDGYVVTLTEIQLVNNHVNYIELNGGCVDDIMAIGEIAKILSCLPDDEEFSLLNTILEKDSLYRIKDRLLKSLPLYKKDMDRITDFVIRNSALLLIDRQGKINAYSKKDEIDSFIKYLNNAEDSMEIRADFFRIMSNIMEIDDVEKIWNNYKEEIIDNIRECSDEEYNDSDVRIAISHLLRDKLLNE